MHTAASQCAPFDSNFIPQLLQSNISQIQEYQDEIYVPSIIIIYEWRLVMMVLCIQVLLNMHPLTRTLIHSYSRISIISRSYPRHPLTVQRYKLWLLSGDGCASFACASQRFSNYKPQLLQKLMRLKNNPGLGSVASHPYPP